LRLAKAAPEQVKNLLQLVSAWKLQGMLIEQIFISSGHNYFGHHGKLPDNFPLVPIDRVECVAGRGLRGDRFFDYADNYKGQITFFSRETFESLSAHLSLSNKSPGILRRNLIVSGIDLTKLIGVDFELQGVCFRGAAHCKPCYWMNTAVASGTEKFLAGRGGLRARILSSGWLHLGDAAMTILGPAKGAAA
jgi:MOSC domain-containing protein YiiM